MCILHLFPGAPAHWIACGYDYFLLLLCLAEKDASIKVSCCPCAALPAVAISPYLFSRETTGVVPVNESITLDDFFPSLEDAPTAQRLLVSLQHFLCVCGGEGG